MRALQQEYTEMPRNQPTGRRGKPVPEQPTNKPAAKRIVIVDDHPLFRKGLAELINSNDGFAISGEAANAADGISTVRRLNPDLVIVDLTLPGTNGIELTKNIRAEFPKLPVLILSMHDESLYALRSLRAGARGYVMKQEALGNVMDAIREVLAGRPYLSQSISATIISQFAQTGESKKVNAVDRLSDRELEILELIGKGHEVREIAKELHLSPKTVETHRAHIKEKLNLPNARQVVRFAVHWLDARNT
jgi:DNA-binding NarL/FixJ family response regulator